MFVVFPDEMMYFPRYFIVKVDDNFMLVLLSIIYFSSVSDKNSHLFILRFMPKLLRKFCAVLKAESSSYFVFIDMIMKSVNANFMVFGCLSLIMLNNLLIYIKKKIVL